MLVNQPIDNYWQPSQVRGRGEARRLHDAGRMSDARRLRDDQRKSDQEDHHLLDLGLGRGTVVENKTLYIQIFVLTVVQTISATRILRTFLMSKMEVLMTSY